MTLRQVRAFVLRGNVVELAVAAALGPAFEAPATAFIADSTTPLTAARGGRPDPSELAATINETIENEIRCSVRSASPR